MKLLNFYTIALFLNSLLLFSCSQSNLKQGRIIASQNNDIKFDELNTAKKLASDYGVLVYSDRYYPILERLKDENQRKKSFYNDQELEVYSKKLLEELEKINFKRLDKQVIFTLSSKMYCHGNDKDVIFSEGQYYAFKINGCNFEETFDFMSKHIDTDGRKLEVFSAAKKLASEYGVLVYSDRYYPILERLKDENQRKKSFYNDQELEVYSKKLLKELEKINFKRLDKQVIFSLSSKMYCLGNDKNVIFSEGQYYNFKINGCNLETTIEFLSNSSK